METDTTMHLTRTYDASPERVWDAFTTPELLRRWYAPVDGWDVVTATVDLRVGGGYHLEFGPPGGTMIVERGTYVELDPPRRIVFTMDLDMPGDHRERTTTTITLTPAGTGTTVSVVEEGYSSPEVTAMHARGWTHMLEQLTHVVA